MERITADNFITDNRTDKGYILDIIDKEKYINVLQNFGIIK